MVAKTISGSGFHFRFVFYTLDLVENEYNIEGVRKNERQEAAGGQTVSGNMAATRYFNLATPTSYSTPYTLWGLSHAFGYNSAESEPIWMKPGAQ